MKNHTPLVPGPLRRAHALGRRQPPMWRPLAGAALGVVGLPLLVVLPEAGLPLVLVALRLLATRYRWAARADAQVRQAAALLRAWFVARPRPFRFVLGGAVAIAVVVALGWVVSTVG